MAQLTDTSSNPTLTTFLEGLTPQLVAHLSDAASLTTLVQAALSEQRRTHCLAAGKIAVMIEAGEQMIEAAADEGRMTPHKALALHYLKLAYVYEILSIADTTDDKIRVILLRWLNS